MPITQSRLRDLLEEYENLIAGVQAAIKRGHAIMASETLSGADKADLLFGELRPLGTLPRMLALVERRDLNRNWKSNQKRADYAARKRRERGVPERGKPTDSDWLPRTYHNEQYIEDDGYDAWNRDEANKAQPRAVSNPTAEQIARDDAATPRAIPEGLDVYLCQHELGLANSPTTEQLAKWRAERSAR